MTRLKTHILGLISICSWLAVSCKAVHETPVAMLVTNATKLSKYQMRIKTGQAEVTGVLIIKYIDDQWRGSLMNEFGVKAFDFAISKGKCSLLNVIPFLDKWYIRRTVESDFTFLFRDAPHGKMRKNKQLIRINDNAFMLRNEKRNIEYQFQSFDL